MKGFEIQINGGAPDSHCCRTLRFRLVGVCEWGRAREVDINGEGNLTERFTWWNGALENGDKIRVRVVETECPSVPILVRKRSWEDLYERYEKLKIELRNLGRIE